MLHVVCTQLGHGSQYGGDNSQGSENIVETILDALLNIIIVIVFILFFVCVPFCSNIFVVLGTFLYACEMIMNRQSIKLLFQQSLQYLSALCVEIV